MTKQNQLMAAAIAAFEQWRRARVHPTQRTPDPLQQQAVALLEHYAFSQITSTLNISVPNLKRWAQSSPQTSEIAEFVALPHVRVDEPHQPELSLELAFNNGCHMRLQGDISPEHLIALTQGVTALSEVRS
ncbi:MAG: hypothetical protein ACI8WB_003507 [Phenylobacterium sp.]|jgi:hypothetical protein